MPGSYTWSDEWLSHNTLSDLGFEQNITVNHLENFIDPITGINRQIIEGTWKKESNGYDSTET